MINFLGNISIIRMVSGVYLRASRMNKLHIESQPELMGKIRMVIREDGLFVQAKKSGYKVNLSLSHSFKLARLNQIAQAQCLPYFPVSYPPLPRPSLVQ